MNPNNNPTDAPKDEPKSTRTKNTDKLWDEVESLFGAWADIDMSDDWLDNLRDRDSERFADLWR